MKEYAKDKFISCVGDSISACFKVEETKTWMERKQFERGERENR